MFKVLIHERSKDVKILPDGGFDLTVLLFGVFVPLWRGQYKRALSYLAIVICTLFVAWVFIFLFQQTLYQGFVRERRVFIGRRLYRY